MRTIFASRVVHCPYSSAAEFAEPFFKENLSASPLGGLATRVRIKPRPVGDLKWRGYVYDALGIQWFPKGSRRQRCTALLTMRPHEAGATLSLEVAYEAPFGLLGKLLDVMFGRLIVQWRVAQLIEKLASDVADQWILYRMNLQSPAMASRYCN